ncbi:MAG TPA: zf-HC2 domain-containing protein [Pyrinomonadaceae bacterium]
MNSNNHNSSCNFSDLLVSYLYGEIGEKEKSRFESHVSNCSACSDEISAFGGVRASVRNWRETEFYKLPTPVIALPSEPEKATILTTETNAASRTWLAGLRELFSLSPAWTGAGVACAALAICAGLFYVAVSSLQSERRDVVAEANKNNSVASLPSPTVQTTPTASTAGTNDEQPVEAPKPEIFKDKKQNPSKSASVSERAVFTENTNVKAVKANLPPKPVVNKDKTLPNVKKAPKQTDIEFTTREEEDKSLRLSDLFDEVSMKE